MKGITRDFRTAEELMRAAMGGEDGQARQRSKNAVAWRSVPAKAIVKADRPSAEHRTVAMFPKSSPQQMQLGLGFYLDAPMPNHQAIPDCSCGRFKRWMRRADGNEYCSGCGRWSLYERKKVAPPSPPSSNRSEPAADGAKESDAATLRGMRITVDESLKPHQKYMLASSDWEVPREDITGKATRIEDVITSPEYAKSVWARHPEVKPAAALVAKATKRTPKPRAPHGGSAKPHALKGIKKAPPGHVWWVSEEWTRRWQAEQPGGGSAALRCYPEPVDFTMQGMHIETGVGIQGSKGAMYAHAAREAKRREQAFLTTRAKCKQFVGWPVRVQLTRESPSEFDDDNLRAAFKRIRDGICEALGFRDDKVRPGFLDWKYAQVKGGSRKSKTAAAVAHVHVRVEVMR